MIFDPRAEERRESPVDLGTRSTSHDVRVDTILRSDAIFRQCVRGVKSHFLILMNNKIKKWDFLKIQNYGADIYCKVSTTSKKCSVIDPTRVREVKS